MNTDSAIETPDEYTIVFHTKKPFAAFDYLGQQPNTMPVPKDKDTGAKYRNSIVSTGPYKFADLQPGKSFNLVRNDQWDPATDPNRKALPDRIEVTLNVNADDIDNRLISGDLDVDVVATGVQPAAQSRVSAGSDPQGERGQPARVRGSGTPRSTRQFRRSTTSSAARRSCTPWTDTAYQTAYGGQFAGGDLATTLLPPTIPGHIRSFDLYPNGPDHKGDLDAAKKSLEACGQPNGFETNIAYRAERPKEKATAEAFQQALARVGHQAHAEAVPARRLLRPIRRPSAVRGEEQAGSGAQRLGGRLA